VIFWWGMSFSSVVSQIAGCGDRSAWMGILRTRWGFCHFLLFDLLLIIAKIAGSHYNGLQKLKKIEKNFKVKKVKKVTWIGI
jgi:hypothetical protein